MSRPRCLLAAVLVLLATVRAAAEPAPATPPAHTNVITLEPRLLCVPGIPVERCIEIPPGRFLSQDKFDAVELEISALQNTKTRLEAENKSLRATASGWQPGWKTLALTYLGGMIAGVYLYAKLD